MRRAAVLTLSLALATVRAAGALASPAFTPGGSFTALGMRDVAGGLARGGSVQSCAFAQVESDLAAATRGAWPGARAFASAAWIAGGAFSSRFSGDVLGASNVEAAPVLRLYEAWLEQDVPAAHATVRGGVLAADEEFAGCDAASVLTNGAFGWVTGIAANVPGGSAAYPMPVPGLRVTCAPPAFTLRAAVFDGDALPDAGDAANRAHGLGVRFDHESGALLVAEAEKRLGAQDAPGACVKAGAWRHTAAVEDARFDADGAPAAASGRAFAVHGGTGGFYALAEGRVWRPRQDAGERGLRAWVRGEVAPGDRGLFSQVGEAGCAWTGPFAGRPDDVFGAGIVVARAGDGMRGAALDARAAGAPGGPVPDHESVLEIAWRARLASHVAVTPGAQWIRHPGASAAVPDARVVFLRVSVE